jgi:glycosyltransferase involved in cell wall biosynthesis
MASGALPPLLVGDGDIPTTRLIGGVLRTAYGGVEVRVPGNLFGADFHRRPVMFSRVCQPEFSWLPGYLSDRHIPYAYFLDDNFWELTPEVDAHLAPFYQDPVVVATLDLFVRSATVTVVWSPRLRRYLQERFPDARVDDLPPTFDVDAVMPLLETAHPKHDGVVRIGYPTSRRTSVNSLLVPVVEHICRKYAGRVEFDFVGWMPDALAATPGVVLHPQIPEYNRYLEFKISRQWDLGLAPLLGRIFESCKTNNKYREYGGCRVAGLYSDASPYVECVEHGRNGYLARNDPDAWIAALETLIDGPELRRTIAENAFADVKRHYNQATSAERLRDLLASLVIGAPAPSVSSG